RLVGLLAGAAWATKYTALPACAGLALAAAWLREGRPRTRLAAAAWVGAVTVCVGLLWNVRSWVLTGNPLYPAFYGLLGGRYWSETSAAAMAAEVSHGGFGDRGPAAYLLALRDLILHSEGLGFPSGINVLYVLVALAGIPLFRRIRGGSALLLVAGVSYAGWCTTSLNLRYALFMLAVLAPFAAAACDRGVERLGRVLRSPLAASVPCLVLAVAVAGPMLLTIERHTRLYGDGTRLLGGTPRAELHATRLQLGLAGRELAAALPAEARILLIGEGRVGLLPRPAAASSAYDEPDIARYLRDLASIREVNRRLGEFTHVVVNYRELERFNTRYGFSGRFSPEAWKLFNDWLANGLIPVARYGNVVVYRIPDDER
ncbi:MAG TPA: hypothetical protein VD788_02540, partial [Candidatus Polarisedimenticolaceae bacterium]|nr:hypothetical protein [Candidatus Polarisedimenticolaceae bacterium]